MADASPPPQQQQPPPPPPPPAPPAQIKWTQGTKSGTCVATSVRDIRNALQASGAIISNEVDIVVKMGPWIETALAKLEGDCPQKMLEPETHSLKLSEPKEAMGNLVLGLPDRSVVDSLAFIAFQIVVTTVSCGSVTPRIALVGWNLGRLLFGKEELRSWEELQAELVVWSVACLLIWRLRRWASKVEEWLKSHLTARSLSLCSR